MALIGTVRLTDLPLATVNKRLGFLDLPLGVAGSAY
jgi:hypothetical protein